MFSGLYQKVITWSRHPHAERYLGGLSFAESSFFPIPPDVMLAPMVVATPKRAWRYAAVTTITSVLGGVAGYFIGKYLFQELGQPLIDFYHAQDKMDTVVDWFAQYGVWIVFLAGFTPLPYKVFTLTAGAVSMVFWPFVFASFIGRGARFFLVAGLIKWGGQKLADFLERYVNILGWLALALLAAAVWILKF